MSSSAKFQNCFDLCGSSFINKFRNSSRWDNRLGLLRQTCNPRVFNDELNLLIGRYTIHARILRTHQLSALVFQVVQLFCGSLRECSHAILYTLLQHSNYGSQLVLLTCNLTMEKVPNTKNTKNINVLFFVQNNWLHSYWAWFFRHSRKSARAATI